MKIIEEIIYPVLNEFKEDEDLEFDNSPDLQLFGDGSILDSLSFVRFLVQVQDQILDITDKEIVLADAKAMSRANSPFRTVSTLADYINELLKEA